MKNKGFAQMTLCTYFLHNILDVLAYYGFNPVTLKDNFNKLHEDYPRIAQLFNESPRISRHISPMISNMLEKNCPTYFHCMLLLYHQYMDDANVKEQHYKSLRKFCNKDGPREEKHFSNLTGIMTFKLFFKTVYNYDGASDERAILDIVNTLNIFTLTKEPKKISQGITNYFTFDFNCDDAKKNLEIKLFDNEFPYKYDLTNKKDLKKYFGILDQSQDTILLKMFWAAVQSIHPDTGIFDGDESIMSKNEAINLFASILFCNKRKNDTILPADDDEQDDDDSDYEDSDTDTSE